MKKRIFSIFMSVLMVMSLMSTVAFAAEIETADPSSTTRASSSSFTGFLMNKATITPVVVREGSSYQMALKNYAKTTTFSGSHHNIARWNSYSISGFNQYIIDNNYKMVGWNISVSGKYAVANEEALSRLIGFGHLNIQPEMILPSRKISSILRICLSQSPGLRHFRMN